MMEIMALMVTLNSKFKMSKMCLPFMIMFSTMLKMTSINSIKTSQFSLMFMDHYSSTLCILTSWIMGMAMMSSPPNKSMEFLIMGTWVTLMILFQTESTLIMYITFEMTLIPMMLMILMWSKGVKRLSATLYMIMFMVISSFPLLIMIMKMKIINKTSTMAEPLTMKILISKIETTMILGILMVKSPIFLVHSWLPKAHVEAPVEGSMILAAVLLKMGSYLMIRMTSMIKVFTSIKMIMISVGLIGSIMMMASCLIQPDLKTIVAYSSVAHMSITTAAIISESKTGNIGSMGMIVAHGLCSSSMFMTMNIVYMKSKSRLMFMMKGLVSIQPMLVLMWFLTLSANMAAPPSLSLSSEIMIGSALSKISQWNIPILMLASFMCTLFSVIAYKSTLGSYKNKMMYKPVTTKEYTIIILHLIPLFMMTPIIGIM